MATTLNKSTRSPVADDEDDPRQQHAKLPPSEKPDAQPINAFVPVDIPTPTTPQTAEQPITVTDTPQTDEGSTAYGDQVQGVPQQAQGQTPAQQPSTTAQTPQMQVPALDTPSPVGDLSQYLNTPIAQLPAFKAAMDARNKLVALDALPTYTDSHGKVVTGMQDRNGRLQSGLKGMVSGLAHEFDPANGPVRGWGDLASRATYSISRGVAGAAVPEWDEWADRQRQKAILEQQAQDADKALTVQEHALSADALNKYRTANADLRGRSFEERLNQNKIKNLKSEQDQILRPLFQRGFYYQGEDSALDKKLADAGVTIEDFDKRHPDTTANGQRMTWDLDSRKYVPAAGAPQNPDDIPVKVDIPGVGVIDVTRKTYLGYKAPIEASQVTADQKSTEAEYDQGMKRADLTGRINKAKNDVSAAQKRLDEISNMTGIEKIQAASEVEKLNKEIRESQSDIAGMQGQLEAMPKSPKYQGRPGAKVVPPAKDPLGLFK